MDTNTDANPEKAGSRGPVLILSGIPGAGKTVTAAALARRLGAAVDVVEETVVTREQLDRLCSRFGGGPFLLAVLAPRLTTVARRAGPDVVARWGYLDEVMRRELGEVGLWLDTSELSVTEAAEAIATGFLTDDRGLARLR